VTTLTYLGSIMTEQAPLSPEEQQQKAKQWNQEQFVKVQKYAMSQGVQVKAVKQELTRCLPPLIGIWYLNSSTKGDDYWVISGEFPTDLTKSTSAKNAREVIRHFSMQWQLKAANLEAGLAEGKVQLEDKETQQKFIDELVSKAEFLYQIYSDNKLWQGSGLEDAVG
jgi:hypothetical protein